MRKPAYRVAYQLPGTRGVNEFRGCREVRNEQGKDRPIIDVTSSGAIVVQFRDVHGRTHAVAGAKWAEAEEEPRHQVTVEVRGNREAWPK